jgi:hypothetical protein
MTMSTKIDVQTAIEPDVDPAFLRLMQVHRRGDCLDELGQALREVSKTAQLTGKAATLTLKIKVAPTSTVKGAVSVTDEIKLTLPKMDKGGSLFYSDENGALLRDDPKQGHLELKTVTGGPRDGAVELKKV